MAAVADSQLVSVLTLEFEVNRDAANQLVRFWLTSLTVAWEVVELKTAIRLAYIFYSTQKFTKLASLSDSGQLA